MYFSGRCEATTSYTLANWQAEFSQEKGSSFQLQDGAPYFTSIGRNLIDNESMTISCNGWASWPSMKSIEQDDRNLIYGPSLKVTNLPGGDSEVLVYHAGFALEKSKTYRLTVTAMSEEAGWIQFVPMMANEPWRSLGRSVCFEVDKLHNSFTYFFQPDISSQEARITFKANLTFWLDEVSLYEVTTANKRVFSSSNN
jgi:hypothetical protein